MSKRRKTTGDDATSARVRIDAQRGLAALEDRANITHHGATREITSSEQDDRLDVLVYEDHRTILTVLAFAKELGSIAFPVNLVYHDLHDDCFSPSPSAMKIIRDFQKTWPGLREFWSFVEWDLGREDHDWLIAGMELGLIGDAILIGGEEVREIENREPTHTDSLGRAHHLFSVGHVYSGLGHHGWLTDFAAPERFRRCWSALGWNGRRFEGDLPAPLVVDFDLDCFTIAAPGARRIAWPLEIMEELFRTSGAPDTHYDARSFLRWLMSRAAFVTICRESRYCGGSKQAQRVLEQLDRLIFNSEITTHA